MPTKSIIPGLGQLEPTTSIEKVECHWGVDFKEYLPKDLIPRGQPNQWSTDFMKALADLSERSGLAGRSEAVSLLSLVVQERKRHPDQTRGVTVLDLQATTQKLVVGMPKATMKHTEQQMPGHAHLAQGHANSASMNVVNNSQPIPATFNLAFRPHGTRRPHDGTPSSDEPAPQRRRLDQGIPGEDNHIINQLQKKITKLQGSQNINLVTPAPAAAHDARVIQRLVAENTIYKQTLEVMNAGYENSAKHYRKEMDEIKKQGSLSQDLANAFAKVLTSMADAHSTETSACKAELDAVDALSEVLERYQEFENQYARFMMRNNFAEYLANTCYGRTLADGDTINHEEFVDGEADMQDRGGAVEEDTMDVDSDPFDKFRNFPFDGFPGLDVHRPSKFQ